PRHSTPPEKRGVGLVFQDYALFPHLTVVDNVRFGLTGVSATAQQRQAMETLARVGMVDQAHSYPHTLSGGQQQRVALARALAPQPRVLLLDEPFSGLDIGLRNQVRDETLHLLKQNGAATMIVTHDPEEAMFLADRIALMHDGSLTQIGTPVDLYCRPDTAFAAEFFGEVNRLTGQVGDELVPTPFGELSASGFASGTPVEILIRPEALRLAASGPNIGNQDARVEAARLLGRTSLIHLAVPTEGGETIHIHARMPGQFLPAEESFVTIELDRGQTFIFPLVECA
ncbi:MAG: ABC transporter ATP-binding protein, partial [Pseudomonadota bacterium]